MDNKWDSGDWKVPVLAGALKPRSLSLAERKKLAKEWLDKHPPPVHKRPSLAASFRRAFARLGFLPEEPEPRMSPIDEAQRILEKSREMTMRAYCRAILELEDE